MGEAGPEAVVPLARGADGKLGIRNSGGGGGLFTSLGCQIHFATPYHGQAKPIERAFRDMAKSIELDPRFAGA